MTTNFFTLVYASQESARLSQVQLIQLLIDARDYNERVGITGLLLHHRGQFMQLLEGPEEAVRAITSRIARDTRHHGFRVLLEEFRGGRRFAEWSMAFEDIDDMDAVLHPGASTALTGEPLTAGDPADRALQLLESFRTGGWSGKVG